jgi:hypothetical protein
MCEERKMVMTINLYVNHHNRFPSDACLHFEIPICDVRVLWSMAKMQVAIGRMHQPRGANRCRFSWTWQQQTSMSQRNLCSTDALVETT